jgi:uncharacterized protein (DUF2267 family)
MAIDDALNRFRRTVATIGRLPAALSVEGAASAVVCVLTERLTGGEAHALLRGLSPALQRLFEQCIVDRMGNATITIDRAELVGRVADDLGITPAHAELVCSAVFAGLREDLPTETALHVAAQLPRDLQELWLGPPIVAPDLDVDIAPADTLRTALRDLERRASLPAEIAPLTAFEAVLCRLSQRLSGGETRHIRLGLPEPFRPFLDRCAAHRSERAALFDEDELVASVGEHLSTDRVTAAHIVVEVLRALRRVLPQRVTREIGSQLPYDLRQLWESSLPAHARGDVPPHSSYAGRAR